MSQSAGANPTASAAELEAYEQLQVYSLGHGGADFIHQHVVDAWAAQHASEDSKPIGLTFALVGLYLHLEKGFSGRQVQRTHILMGRRKQAWPRFLPPQQRGKLTVLEVMAAPPGLQRDQAIRAWCESVWAAYRENRAAVIELLRGYGIE